MFLIQLTTRDLQHFMLEQSDFHTFKAVINGLQLLQVPKQAQLN